MNRHLIKKSVVFSLLGLQISLVLLITLFKVIIAPGQLPVTGPSIQTILYGAGSGDTSAYLLGDVVMALVLSESNGEVDDSTQDWTTSEVLDVQNTTVAGLDAWVQAEPNASLTFIYVWADAPPPGGVSNTVESDYEAEKYINNFDPNVINSFMARLGYTNFYYLTNIYDYLNDLRTAYGANWAYLVQVQDDERTVENECGVAGSIYRGPALTLYDCDLRGGYTVAHKTGHIFGTKDEYCPGACLNPFAFDASGSSDGETPSANLQFRWDFNGDTAVTARHIWGNPYDHAPVVNGIFSSSTGSATTPIPLDFSLTSDADSGTSWDGLLEYRFDWDSDGNWDADFALASVWGNYKLAEPGDYPITMQVRDRYGATAQASELIAIAGPPPPIASFSGIPTNGSVPLSVNFTNSSSGSYTACSWDFGDGSSSAICNPPAHSYSQAGAYTVSLTASGPSGNDTHTKINYVTVYAGVFLPIVITAP